MEKLSKKFILSELSSWGFEMEFINPMTLKKLIPLYKDELKSREESKEIAKDAKDAKEKENSLSSKNNANVSIRLERKYLIDYSAMSRDAQRKFRGKKRRDLFNLVDKFYLANLKNDEEMKEKIANQFKDFAESTYANVDYNHREIFFHGDAEKSKTSRKSKILILF